jgi:hypothetical protein
MIQLKLLVTLKDSSCQPEKGDCYLPCYIEALSKVAKQDSIISQYESLLVINEPATSRPLQFTIFYPKVLQTLILILLVLILWCMFIILLIGSISILHNIIDWFY